MVRGRITAGQPLGMRWRREMHSMARILLTKSVNYSSMNMSDPKAKHSKSHSPLSDVVGIELGANLSSGTPAVRLKRRADGVIEIVAAGFLPFDSTPPESADKVPEGVSWMLPKSFGAISAALAITSEEALLRQSSGSEDALADKDRSRYRIVLRPDENDSLSFVAAVPEYMACWAARLLPESRRPTACSIQVSDLARMNAFAVSEAFRQTNGTALLLLVGLKSTALVIFNEYKPLLYRKHSIGSEDVLDAVSRSMNLDRSMAEKILNDTLIDPTSVLEPVLSPLFRQAELSTDYAVRKNGCFIEKFFLCGLTTGAQYWADIFKRKTGGEILPCNPAEDFPRAEGALLHEAFETCSASFIPAIGAAVAVLEDA